MQHHSSFRLSDPGEYHPPEFRQWRESFVKQHRDLCERREPGQGIQYRFAEIDHTRAQAKQRTVEAVLSAGTQVRRRGYDEQLEMSADAVDLSRVESMGGLPMLWSHDPSQHLGWVENVRIFDGVLRGRLKFTDSQLAEEKWRAVQDGTLRGISVGYGVDGYDWDESGEPPVMNVTRWIPMEASLVAIPADTSAQVGRALDLGILNREPNEQRFLRLKRETLRDVDMLALSAQDEGEGVPDAVTDAVDAARDLLMSAATPQDLDAVRAAMSSAWTAIEEWTQGSETSTVRSPDQMNRSENPMSDFSLTRALSARIDPNAAARASHELSVSEQLTTQSDITPRGVMVPGEAIFQRAFVYATESGNAVSTQHLASAFVEGLRSKLVSGELGVRILDGLRGNVQIPKLATDVSTSWIAGDGGDTITDSEPALTKIEMSPKFVGGRTIISRRMLVQSDPAAEQIVRESMGAMLAKAVDNAILNGTGENNQPTGVLTAANTNSDTYSNGGSPSFGQIVDMEGAIQADDAGGSGGLVYLMHPGMAATLKQTDIGTDTGEMIWRSTQPGVGMVNGYRAMTTTLVPAGTIILGDWRQVLLGVWSGVDVIVDEVTRSSYLDVIITGYLSLDVAVRHPEAFCILSEAAP